jgi:hypothetical protein
MQNPKPLLWAALMIFLCTKFCTKNKNTEELSCAALIGGIAVTSHSLFCFKDGFDHPPKQIFLTPILHKKIPTVDAIVVIIGGLC